MARKIGLNWLGNHIPQFTVPPVNSWGIFTGNACQSKTHYSFNITTACLRCLLGEDDPSTSRQTTAIPLSADNIEFIPESRLDLSHPVQRPLKIKRRDMIHLSQLSSLYIFSSSTTMRFVHSKETENRGWPRLFSVRAIRDPTTKLNTSWKNIWTNTRCSISSLNIAYLFTSSSPGRHRTNTSVRKFKAANMSSKLTQSLCTRKQVRELRYSKHDLSMSGWQNNCFNPAQAARVWDICVLTSNAVLPAIVTHLAR